MTATANHARNVKRRGFEMDESILLEADRITSQDRQKDYGHPLDDYRRTAKLWSAVLGVEVTASQAILCMILLKVSRECNKHKRDNLVDVAGYAKCLEQVEERLKQEKIKV